MMMVMVMKLHRRSASANVMIQQVPHGERRSLRLLLLVMLLLLQLGELLCDLRAIRADLAMVTELATLSKVALTQIALERFLARVCIFVLLAILLEAESFSTETALEILLRVVLLVVSLQAEFCLEGGRAPVDVAFKDCQAFLTITISAAVEFRLQRAI